MYWALVRDEQSQWRNRLLPFAAAGGGKPVFVCCGGREKGVWAHRSHTIGSIGEALYIGRMEERNLMRKRISVLIAALMLALTMSLGGVAFADPDCDKVPNNKNCVVEGPGNSENSQGNAQEKNPNVEKSFKGRPQ
jgi:hypothetical protein